MNWGSEGEGNIVCRYEKTHCIIAQYLELLISLLFRIIGQDPTDKDGSQLKINERELYEKALWKLKGDSSHLETFWYIFSSASVSSTWMKASTRATTGLVSSLCNF